MPHQCNAGGVFLYIVHKPIEEPLMSKKQREQYQEFFLTVPTDNIDSVSSAHTSNLEAFCTRLSYISASVTGGKMNVKEAELRVKDLYKVWKRSNKSLGDELN